ncbi:MAG: fructose-bisphosphate aldolase class I [Gemmatimonadota bacterium]|nr:fructose-bisphosphate aldolase class I [Gemmatimonadota bacterium]MDH5197677.1 fructose-bisphosphate aldolase class I [Gemmatimonadota bacterium]
MAQHDLTKTARAMVAKGKGILAADESFGTIEKRFKSINIASTEEQRRAYREMLFTTGDFGDYISGVIMFDETIRHKTAQGMPFVDLLRKANVIPGIKVDSGAKDLAGYPGEKITEGLDGLRERVAEYYKLGARFAKWRAVITIGDAMPTRFCIDANAHALARYAALCQEAGIVPIVEPEVLMDGGHSGERCEEVTTTTLESVFFHLHAHRVSLEGMVLKPNMVIPGKKAAQQWSPRQIAEATVRCFMRTVPAAVPGIVFLSGGQTPAEATANLDAMNKMGTHPWELSYSYGRALQDEALKAWLGKPENVAAGQKMLAHRGHLVSAARYGKYNPKMESAA